MNSSRFVANFCYNLGKNRKMDTLSTRRRQGAAVPVGGARGAVRSTVVNGTGPCPPFETSKTPSMCLLVGRKSCSNASLRSRKQRGHTQAGYYVQQQLVKRGNGTCEHAMNPAGDKAHLSSIHPRLVDDFLWHNQPVNASLIYHAPK